MFNIQRSISRTAKRAGLMSGGALLCTVGTAFLTVSAWFAMLPALGPAITALLIAGAYLGAGLICFGIASRKGRDRLHTHAVPPDPSAAHAPPAAPGLVQAFLFGLQAGASAEKKRP